jgi:putative N-acetyltransferase (TIGR04045 family)
MMYGSFLPFVPAEYRIKYAVKEWELNGVRALRRAVFCDEQKIFSGDDRDAIDAIATPLAAISLLGVAPDAVVGTVRIHEAEPGCWWGSRLAVHPDFRTVGTLGASLIHLAVTSAQARGCTRFLAHVQRRNVVLFRRLHWRSLAEIDLHGREHHLMEADLAYYPPFAEPEIGFTTVLAAS